MVAAGGGAVMGVIILPKVGNLGRLSYRSEANQEAIRPPARSGKNPAAGKHFDLSRPVRREFGPIFLVG